MPIAATLSLLLQVTPPADGRIPGVVPPTAADFGSAVDWPLGVNANELRLKVFGGFKHEKLATAQVTLYRRLGPTTLYADKHGHLYADRDGDKVIDTGALYNRGTGMISADWDCDGDGDQVLADIKP